METLKSDYYYDQARNFIQTHISSSCISEESNKKLLELYNSINAENAKNVYDEAVKIYNSSAQLQKQNFNMGCLKLFGTIFGIGGIVAIVGYLGNKYIGDPYVNTKWFLSGITKIGLGALALGFVGCASVGH